MNKKQKCLVVLLWIGAICAFSYFVLLMITTGPEMLFNYFWFVISLSFMALALTLQYAKKGFLWMPPPLIVGVELIVFVGLFLFVVIEGIIICSSNKGKDVDADYVIILGAKVNGTKPSNVLQNRIETAAKYLKEHPKAKAIVSGGKGSDEGISEAEAMELGLVSLGIAKDRILKEDKSTNTKENFTFSKVILKEQGVDLSNAQFVVVTTKFHLFRSVRIARKLGFEKIEGVGSTQLWYLIPTNYVREFLAVVKDFLTGNI